MVTPYEPPVIDLDVINDAEDLITALQTILVSHDAFLIRNYANKNSLDELVDNLSVSSPVEYAPKVNNEFSGLINGPGNTVVEQFILSGSEGQLPSEETAMARVHARLLKIATYFAQLAMQAATGESDDENFGQKKLCSRTWRYYACEDAGRKNYISREPAGILEVYPQTRGIRIKPPTSGSGDNEWVEVNKPDCILIHTGKLLALLSRGKHTTSPVQMDQNDPNVVALAIFPSLSMKLEHGSVSDELLKSLIKEFPEVGKKLYPREYNTLCLQHNIKFLKELFKVMENTLSLYLVSGSSQITSRRNPPLSLILHRASAMMQRKNLEDSHVLQILTIWPEAYQVEADSNFELSLVIEQHNPLMALTSQSRPLEFTKRADQWLEAHLQLREVPVEVPFAKRNMKRRGSLHESMVKSPTSEESAQKDLSQRPVANTKKRYLYNDTAQFVQVSANIKHDTSNGTRERQAQLLERVREREKRSATLLIERQEQRERFLLNKMKQVFNILQQLSGKRPAEPHTATHLRSLVVDSLRDTSNPVGDQEADEILHRLQSTLPDYITLHKVDGGLEVYRWQPLDRGVFMARLAAMG